MGLAALASLWMRYSFALLEDFRGRKCSMCYEFFLKAYLCGRPFLLKLLQALVLQCHMALLCICAVTLLVFIFFLACSLLARDCIFAFNHCLLHTVSEHN